MFVVYTTQSDVETGAELQVIELSDNVSAFEIDSLLTGVNWYGSRVWTPEDAIDEAKTANCQFLPIRSNSKIEGLITIPVQTNQQRNRFSL